MACNLLVNVYPFSSCIFLLFTFVVGWERRFYAARKGILCSENITRGVKLSQFKAHYLREMRLWCRFLLIFPRKVVWLIKVCYIFSCLSVKIYIWFQSGFCLNANISNRKTENTYMWVLNTYQEGCNFALTKHERTLCSYAPSMKEII